ncbi:hypothetical protein ACEPAH_1270 [Sanghuangporus vaninii]
MLTLVDIQFLHTSISELVTLSDWLIFHVIPIETEQSKQALYAPCPYSQDHYLISVWYPMAALNISTITSAHFLFLLHESLATLLIGIIVAAMLFGIISIQAFAYFQTSKSDPVYLKLMFFASFIGTEMLIVSAGDKRFYHSHVLHTANLDHEQSKFAFDVHSSGPESCSIHCSLHTFTEVPDISWLMYTTLSLGVAADLWSALSLCYFLRKGGSDFQSTSTVINKLAIYVIGTGMLTSFVAIACLVSFTVKSNVGFYTAIYGCLSTFYFNALLATLNMRKHLRENMACMVGNNSQPRTTQSNLESQVNFESDVDNKSFAVTMKIQTVHHAD